VRTDRESAFLRPCTEIITDRLDFYRRAAEFTRSRPRFRASTGTLRRLSRTNVTIITLFRVIRRRRRPISARLFSTPESNFQLHFYAVSRYPLPGGGDTAADAHRGRITPRLRPTFGIGVHYVTLAYNIPFAYSNRPPRLSQLFGNPPTGRYAHTSASLETRLRYVVRVLC